MLKYLSILFCLLISLIVFAQKQPIQPQISNGKILAKNCIDCHGINKATLADPLQGIRKIRTANYIYSLMKNPMRFADENKTAKKVFAKRGLQMPSFPDLSKTDIKAILDYFDSIPNNQKN
jgi:mono/diheme cytochrome c family protein